MAYPKYKYSKTETVLVMSEEHEKELGKGFFESPVLAESEFDYEGKILKPAKVEKPKGGDK